MILRWCSLSFKQFFFSFFFSEFLQAGKWEGLKFFLSLSFLSNQLKNQYPKRHILWLAKLWFLSGWWRASHCAKVVLISPTGIISSKKTPSALLFLSSSPIHLSRALCWKFTIIRLYPHMWFCTESGWCSCLDSWNMCLLEINELLKRVATWVGGHGWWWGCSALANSNDFISVYLKQELVILPMLHLLCCLSLSILETEIFKNWPKVLILSIYVIAL